MRSLTGPSDQVRSLGIGRGEPGTFRHAPTNAAVNINKDAARPSSFLRGTAEPWCSSSLDIYCSRYFGRVGMAGRPTTPLTEPDLWASHPALWNEFFMVKQRKLTRDQLHSV